MNYKPHEFFEEKKPEGQKDPYDPNIPEVEIHDMSHLNAMLKPCKHHYIRKSFTEVECKLCASGWIDAGRFTVKDGAITHIDNNPI